MIHESDLPHPIYVTCRCQYCGNGIEFDASDLNEGEIREIECPHCHRNTQILVKEKNLQRINSKKRIPLYMALIWAALVVWAFIISSWIFNRKAVSAKETTPNGNASSRAISITPEDEVNNYINKYGYFEDTNCPDTSLSIDLQRTKSDIPFVYSRTTIRYVNQQCLEIEVSFDPEVNSSPCGVLFMRKEVNDFIQCLAKYDKWCQISQSQQLAYGVTNTLPGFSYYNFLDVHNLDHLILGERQNAEFVTPDILMLGGHAFYAEEVDVLERLVSQMPQLDAELKTSMDAQFAQQFEESNEVQVRENEENRAKSLLQ